MVRIGVITDIHIAPPGQPEVIYHNLFAFADATERFQQAIACCVDAGAEMIAMLGDLTNYGDEECLAQGVACAMASPLPVWMLAGNHDLLDSAASLPRAVTQAGAERVRLASAEGEGAIGFHVAGVELQGCTETDEGRAAVIDTEPWGSESVILLSHFPLLSLREQASAAGLKYAGDLEDLAQITAPLHGRSAPTVVVHGHLHLSHAMACGTVLQLSCAALIEPPFAASLLDLSTDGGDLTVRYQELPVAPVPDVPLPRISGPRQTWRFADGAWRSDDH